MKKCCKNASEFGHFECLKYLHENGLLWNQNCCEYASKNGHLEYLNYLKENELPWK